MVTGGNTSPPGASSDTTNALIDASTARGLHHHLGGNDTSPLQIFVRAKKKINDIYSEIEEYVVETTRFIDGKLIVVRLLSAALYTNTSSQTFLPRCPWWTNASRSCSLATC